jgi:hypothetical protein
MMSQMNFDNALYRMCQVRAGHSITMQATGSHAVVFGKQKQEKENLNDDGPMMTRDNEPSGSQKFHSTMDKSPLSNDPAAAVASVPADAIVLDQSVSTDDCKDRVSTEKSSTESQPFRSLPSTSSLTTEVRELEQSDSADISSPKVSPQRQQNRQSMFHSRSHSTGDINGICVCFFCVLQ